MTGHPPDIADHYAVPAGAELLDDLHDAVTRYVVLPSEHAADAVVLWIAASHALPAWQHAPRLAIASPEKRCGKSRLLDVIAATCHDPLVTVNATVAAVFRSLAVDEDHPRTLLVDEADTIFATKPRADQNEDLRGLLNAGHQRNRPATRCVGPQQTPTEFPTFAMAALAGIGTLPDTITDRAVSITMRRRRPDERVAPYRTRRDEPALHELRDRLAGWIAEQIDRLAELEPPMPVEDRAADTWEPLIVVADAAGGAWPARARAACRVIVAEAEERDEDASLNVRLLADVRAVFGARSASFVATADLLDGLRQIDEAPWRDFDLTARKLAYRLRGFGVRPDVDATRTRRGYRLADLLDAFGRYLRPGPSNPSNPSGTPLDQREHADGSDDADGSTRPESVTRPAISAGGDGSRTGWTGEDVPPAGNGSVPPEPVRADYPDGLSFAAARAAHIEAKRAAAAQKREAGA